MEFFNNNEKNKFIVIYILNRNLVLYFPVVSTFFRATPNSKKTNKNILEIVVNIDQFSHFQALIMFIQI